MPQFISKLQYKTCEKGEYYDEQPRDLEETIELINNFVFARERYADLDVTGPTVTILDNKGNYLKVGTYLGRRFKLYYLGIDNRFYEWQPLNIEEVYEAVGEFFDGRLDLQNFEKMPFEAFRRRHFITGNFEYRIRLWSAVLFSNDLNFWMVPLVAILVLFIIKNPFTSVRVGFLLILVLVLVFLADRIVQTFLKLQEKKNQYLKISRGNPEFLFGDRTDKVTIYNKGDIKEIICYDNDSYKRPNKLRVILIVFNNNSILCFPNMLIGYSVLLDKFPDKWKFERTVIKTNFWAILRHL